MPINRSTVIIGAAAVAAARTAEASTSATTTAPSNTPTERVLGIGGVFFRSRDPQKLTQQFQTEIPLVAREPPAQSNQQQSSYSGIKTEFDPSICFVESGSAPNNRANARLTA